MRKIFKKYNKKILFLDDRFEKIKYEISKIFIEEDELHKVKDAMQKFQHWFMIKVIIQTYN